ncbi:MAG TPA: hydrogenase maturation protease [Vicinamibacterales bacterium]|nr:hydrogenase maturation protease [Vicinamibacterales bacterium]
MSERTALLVLGLGNLLLEDDGVGSAAMALLNECYVPPDGARVLDGGTLGLSLLPYLEDAEAVILVDAVKTDAPPGTFVRLDGDDVGPAVGTRLSPHQIGVADLLDGARLLGRYPPRVVLLGLVPGSMELAVGLSPSVRIALPGLVERIVGEAHALGFVFSRRRIHDTPLAGRFAPHGGDDGRMLGR